MTVYKITNKLNGKTFIGKTKVPVEVRWYNHCMPKNKSTLARAIRKFGKDSFSILVLGEYKTLQEAKDAEEYFIEFYNCAVPIGYNLLRGTYSTSESRKKTSKTMKRIWKEKKNKVSTMISG